MPKTKVAVTVDAALLFPLTMEIRAVGLPKRSWVKIGQIRTVSTERVGRRLARASDEDLLRIVEGLNEILG